MILQKNNFLEKKFSCHQKRGFIKDDSTMMLVNATTMMLVKNDFFVYQTKYFCVIKSIYLI